MGGAGGGGAVNLREVRLEPLVEEVPEKRGVDRREGGEIFELLPVS